MLFLFFWLVFDFVKISCFERRKAAVGDFEFNFLAGEAASVDDVGGGGVERNCLVGELDGMDYAGVYVRHLLPRVGLQAGFARFAQCKRAMCDAVDIAGVELLRRRASELSQVSVQIWSPPLAFVN